MKPEPAPPRRRAVALSYDPLADSAPRVAAAGAGLIAEEILRRALEAGVPITQDAPLVELLSKLDIGEVIPPELYLAVAEVLAYVYRLEASLARSSGRRSSAHSR